MQFDVFKNPDPRSRAVYPLVVKLQSELLDSLHTVVVAPLAASKKSNQHLGMTRLHPIVEVNSYKFIVLMSLVAAIEGRILGSSVGNIEAARASLVSAYDFLISGV